ncbi:MAG: hypothetical protein HWN68_12815 [Desulfobacterales bacterium]|nr:hypothetical protein [Desulfobacterales bacterium]
MSTKIKVFNHDYPYHDYKKFTDTDNGSVYVVGDANKYLEGDQHKNFISKDTIIYCDGAATIRLNNAENVLIDVIAAVILNLECNIKSIHIVTVEAEKTLYVWMEGVLPEETRYAE